MAAVSVVSLNKTDKRFRVALSFPGEKREFVEQVAEELSESLGKERVLYDDYLTPELARLDLDLHLGDLYRNHSDLVVPFFCSDYERKKWCKLEWRQMRDLLHNLEGDRIMPFRFDDTPISGLLSIDGYVEIADHTPQEVANLILQRLCHSTTGTEELPKKNKWRLPKTPLLLWIFIAVALCFFVGMGIVGHVKSAAQVKALRAQLTAAQTRDMSGSELLAEFRHRLLISFSSPPASSESGDDLSRISNEMARDYGLTVDELSRRMLLAANGAVERRDIAALLQKAGQSDVNRVRKVRRNAVKEIATGATEIATGATVGKNFKESLANYQHAADLTVKSEEPVEWAELQACIGWAHWQVGAHETGPPVHTHLDAEVTAFRNALASYTGQNLTQELATAQNNLAVSLTHQASLSEFGAGAPLLIEAIGLHREALKFFTRTERERDWASTHFRLGIAYRTQARQTNRTDAIPLLRESLFAFTNALDVWTNSSLDWATAKNSLGNSLFDLARYGAGDTNTLLANSRRQFEDILERIPRSDDEIQWAMIQANYGDVLCVQAMQTNGPVSHLLFEAAATAYQKGMDVFSTNSLQQQWAMTQHDLGNVYRNRALRSERREAMQLLPKAVDAYKSALTVFTPQFHPDTHSLYSQELLKTTILLRISQDDKSKWPPEHGTMVHVQFDQ